MRASYRLGGGYKMFLLMLDVMIPYFDVIKYLLMPLETNIMIRT